MKKIVQKIIILFMILFMTSSGVFSDVIAVVDESIKDVSSDVIMVTGELYIGESDGEFESDDIIMLSRHKDSGDRGYDQSGSLMFGVKTNEFFNGVPVLAKVVLELYEDDILLRTIHTEKIMINNSLTEIMRDSTLVDYDLVKYTCTYYNEKNIDQLVKTYEVENLSLVDDYHYITRELEEAYAFTNENIENDDVNYEKEYLGLFSAETVYFDQLNRAIYPNVYAVELEENEQFYFDYDGLGAVHSSSSERIFYKGEMIEVKNKTLYFDFSESPCLKLNLYQQADNNRGFILSKVLLITPFGDRVFDQKNYIVELMPKLRKEIKQQKETQHGDIVTFEDENFEKAVRNQLGKSSADIYEEDLYYLSSLQVDSRKIKSIEGIQAFKYLKNLDISNNKIRDIEPLSELSYLTALYMGRNRVSDIDALKNLTDLRLLQMESNKIESVDPIRGLSQLRLLYAFDNKIESVEALSDMILLQHLWIDKDEVADIKSLEHLPVLNVR